MGPKSVKESSLSDYSLKQTSGIVLRTLSKVFCLDFEIEINQIFAKVSLFELSSLKYVKIIQNINRKNGSCKNCH